MGVRQEGLELVNDKGQKLIPSLPIAVSVGSSSTLILPANANRRSVRLVNTSTAVISLAFGTNAVLYSGMTLFPAGTYNMDDYDFSELDIFGIASVAASNIAIQEYTL